MSKPPLIIPNRQGPELWPQTMRLPPVVKYHMNGHGLSAEEVLLARTYAGQLLNENDGRIRQYFMRMHDQRNLGIVRFSANAVNLGNGITVRYASNGDLEQLDVVVDAKAVIEQISEKKLVFPATVDIMWVIDTTGSTSEGETAPLPRTTCINMSKRFPKLYTGSTAPVGFRFGMAAQGDFPEVGNDWTASDEPYTLAAPLDARNRNWLLKANAGGDGQEAQYNAVSECASDGRVGWGAVVKIIILSTDEQPHPAGDRGQPYISVGTLDGVLDAQGIYLLYVCSFNFLEVNNLKNGKLVYTGGGGDPATMVYKEVAKLIEQKTLIRPTDPNIL